MVKQKKTKPAPEKEYRFFGFNITIKGEKKLSADNYFALIRKIYSDDIFKNIGGEKAMVLRIAWENKFEFNGEKHRVLYGTITRFTIIDGRKWLNRANKEFQDVEIPENVYPNVFESDFVFIPHAHRFFVRKNSKLPPKAIASFLKQALLDVVRKETVVSVSIIAAQDAIDRIISASDLRRLEIKVSYTNDDIGDEAQELMDTMYKDAHIGSATSLFSPDGTGKINGKSRLVQGLLGLAKENGDVTASVFDDVGKVKKITTSDYPETISVKTSNPENMQNTLFNYVMKRWRGKNGK